MVRKNLHIPDEVVKLVGDVLYSARFRSETQAVVAMLEGASDRLKNTIGYVYLARGEKGLKIGTSVQPITRAKFLKADLLYCISGDRLTELAAHMIWGRYRLTGEWFEDRNEIVEWFAGHEFLEPIEAIVEQGREAIPSFWHDAATDEERAELDRLRYARDSARDEYNAYYRLLMKRCQSRIRYAEGKDKEAD